jgi:hypothetical protein
MNPYARPVFDTISAAFRTRSHGLGERRIMEAYNRFNVLLASYIETPIAATFTMIAKK